MYKGGIELKPIYCEELHRTFISISEASRELGISKQHISECCNGKRKSAGRVNNDRIHWEFIQV